MHPLDLPTTADLSDRRWSVASLLTANLLPLAGVLFLGWRAFDVVFLYWLENVIIGVINVLKMATCKPTPESGKTNESVDRLAEVLGAEKGDQDLQAMREFSDELRKGSAEQRFEAKFFFIPFFTIHYGIFCLVHGVFVCVLLGGGGPFGGGMNPFSAAFEALGRFGILVAVFALAASHLVSFFTNYLGRGEYRRLTPVDLMAQPYGRIIVLHIAIVFGAFLVMAFGSPVWLLVLLVAGKTWYDLKLHLKEHRGAKAQGSHAFR